MSMQEIKHQNYPRKGYLIAEQIIRMIKGGIYKPGAKLPPERAIAEQMKVGRPAVREALSALQIVGIVETRLGDGTYIAANESLEASILKALRLLDESDSPFETIQVRKATEIGVVHLAIRNHDREDLCEIRRLLKIHLDYGRAKRYREFIESSREFHLAIAKATKSNVLVAVTDRLLDMVNQPLWITMRVSFFENAPESIVPRMEVHEQLVDAIEDGDFLRCVELLEDHFDGLIRENYDLDRNSENE